MWLVILDAKGRISLDINRGYNRTVFVAKLTFRAGNPTLGRDTHGSPDLLFSSSSATHETYRSSYHFTLTSYFVTLFVHCISSAATKLAQKQAA